MRAVTTAQRSTMVPDLCEAPVRDRGEGVRPGEDGNLLKVPEHEWHMTQVALRVQSDPTTFRSPLAGHPVRCERRRPEGESPEDSLRDLVDQHPPTGGE